MWCVWYVVCVCVMWCGVCGMWWVVRVVCCMCSWYVVCLVCGMLCVCDMWWCVWYVVCVCVWWWCNGV